MFESKHLDWYWLTGGADKNPSPNYALDHIRVFEDGWAFASDGHILLALLADPRPAPGIYKIVKRTKQTVILGEAEGLTWPPRDFCDNCVTPKKSAEKRELFLEEDRPWLCYTRLVRATPLGFTYDYDLFVKVALPGDLKVHLHQDIDFETGEVRMGPAVFEKDAEHRSCIMPYTCG